MSGPQGRRWSDTDISGFVGHPYDRYLVAKYTFAGFLIASILYGILIVLFFQCMAAPFNPVKRKREGGPFGPVGYRESVRSTALGVVPNVMFLLNYWFADGLLLYRCYLIHAMNPWVIALPCLMYLSTLVMGIMMLFSQTLGTVNALVPDNHYISLPYFSIAISLNILLTLMIIIRLVLHSRNVHAATGSPAGISGLYKTVVTMLIESSALYAVSSLLVIGPMAARGLAVNLFFPILAETQVIAPLLIIRRVANRSALTSSTIVTGNISSFHVRSQEESMGGSGVPLDECLTGLMGRHRNNSGELEAGAEIMVDVQRD